MGKNTAVGARDGDYLTVTDVMVRLGVSRMTVLREFRVGRLRGRRVSAVQRSTILIESASVEEYVAKREGGLHE